MKQVIATLVSLLSLAISSSRGESLKWVPYSAHYSETDYSHSASGETTHKQTITSETRSADGTLLMVTTSNGQNISGKLWRADGQVIRLDYINKQAILGRKAVRRHPQIPAEEPRAIKTFAGLQCEMYPVHMTNGTGTVCIDVNDDILVREEIHMNVQGLQQDLVKELTSIDLNTPVDSSQLRVPDGFEVLTPSTK